MVEKALHEIDGAIHLLQRLAAAETITDYSHILGDHLSFGNSKISKHTAIFNFNSAHDCPNRETQEHGESATGLCQVEFSQCYAQQAETQYGTPLDYRRRQELLWDHLDPDTFARAFKAVVDRKRNSVDSLRFSEAGDFRHNRDIYKADRVAELLEAYDIDVYTYSSSYKLSAWSEVEHFTVNQSVAKAEYGNRCYNAVATKDEIPDDAIHCPHDYQKKQGKDDPIKCGECRSCITPNGPDVYITLH